MAAPNSKIPNLAPTPRIGYRFTRCIHNHAAYINGVPVFDGCPNFIPSGPDGTLEANYCLSCSCHLNCHRKNEGDLEIPPRLAAPAPPLPLIVHRAPAMEILNGLRAPPPSPNFGVHMEIMENALDLWDDGISPPPSPLSDINEAEVVAPMVTVIEEVEEDEDEQAKAKKKAKVDP